MAGTGFDFDSIIIGGGFAGVTACRDLAEQGSSVLLLEARARLGGRTWSETRAFGDFEAVVELGGQWVYADGQVTLMGEMERYGFTLGSTPESQSFPVVLNGKHLAGPMPVPWESIFDFERAVHQLLTDAHRINPNVPADLQGIEDLDIPWSEYIAKLDVDEDTTAYLNFAPGLYCTRYPDEVSALHFLHVVAQLDYSLIRAWGVLEDWIKGGTSALISAIAGDARQHLADIRLDQPVARVAQDDEGATVTTVSGESFTARTIIVATPMAAWTTIDFDPPLNPHKQAASEEHHVAYPIKVWAQVKNAPKFPYILADPATNNGAVELHTEHDLGEDGQIMVGFYINHPDRPNQFGVDFAGVEAFIKTMVPEAELVRFELHDWMSDEWSQKGDWVAWKPGRLTKSASHLTSAEGRLFFAGSDISHGWFSWIEGAVQTGRKAAVDAQRVMVRDAIEVTV